MTLRRDIHASFEAITPSLGGIPERVVQTVLADKSRRRKEKVAYRFRVPFALVAAALLLAVAAAVVMTWTGLRNSTPAGHSGLTPVQQLEARPLRLPLFNSVLDCTSGPYNAEGSLGAGPIYGDGGAAVRTQWGEYFYNVAYTDAEIEGPIIVRVRDVYKKDVRILFIGPFAGGPTVGTDVVDGVRYDQHTEVILDENRSLPTANPGWSTSHHRFVWDLLAGLPKNGSGGTGWQIDGQGFSETFLAC